MTRVVKYLVGTVVMVTVVAACGSVSAKDTSDGKNIWRDLRVDTSSTDGRDRKTPAPEKKVFKDLRVGSCKSQPRLAPPNTSWPARGDAAVSACWP